MAQMDATRAAQLLEKWISFNDMDDKSAWEPGEYSFIQNTSKAIRLSVQVLKGKSSAKGAQLQDAAAQLEEFADEYGMDSPEEWERENVAYVKETYEAFQFTVSLLRKK
ncbi:hypothetical protein [Paenibacillus sp. DS2015]|uniref:hypothetical protein n=1 Tax=Paenibacillus sp. DS2015 TaxID=3373917 RepID=UPI003D250EA0